MLYRMLCISQLFFLLSKIIYWLRIGVYFAVVSSTEKFYALEQKNSFLLTLFPFIFHNIPFFFSLNKLHRFAVIGFVQLIC